MSNNFVADVRLEETNEVLQVPVLGSRDVKRLAAAAGPKASLPVLDAIPSRDDTLEEYLRYVGLLFGKDPDHWEQVGVPTVEVTEANGKRTITKTGIYSGTELHLWQLSPYFDERLDPRPECPELDFSVAKREISSNEEWRQVIQDQPWTAARRRTAVLRFLTAKLQAASEQLQLEGARGLLELAINREHHNEVDHACLAALVARMCSPNVEVSKACVAVVWGLAVSAGLRKVLMDLGALEVLLEVGRHSLTIPCGDPGIQEQYYADSRSSQAQRNVLQANVLGALSILLVDRQCRRPWIQLEPGAALLFDLASDLEGYADAKWVASRRAAAAKCLASVMQRDHEARVTLVGAGGILRILGLLDTKGPGQEDVQFAMASLLAVLVLDDASMELLTQRGEAPLLFRACLALLSHTMDNVKLLLAEPDSVLRTRLLSEGTVVRKGGGSRGGAAAAAAAAAHAAAEAASGGSEAATARQQQAEAAAQQMAAGEYVPDLEAAGKQVKLAEACSQALWGAANFCLTDPLHITADQVIELGKMALDCVIIEEVDLGRVCHCLAATLATLAAHAPCAAFIMGAPEDSVVRSVLALLDVEEDGALSNAGDIRAAACSCLSFLSCHPLGATGDACLTGPHRPRLLQLGTFSALLKAALASSGEVGEGAMGAAAAVVQQTASVGIMYLATMAGALDAGELAMYAALMTNNSNVGMVEFLMAGMWILLKTPHNRRVLGQAMQVNPAASKLVKGMVNKIQDTIDVAEVGEQAEMIAKARLATKPPGSPASQQHTLHPSATRVLHSSGSMGPYSSSKPSSPAGYFPERTSSPGIGREGEVEAEEGGEAGRREGGVTWRDERTGDALEELGEAGRPDSSHSSARGTGLGLSMATTPRSFDTPRHDYSIMAAGTSTLEEKLAVVETKRRNALLSHLCVDTSGGAGGEGGDASATPDTGPLTARGRSRLAGLTEALGEEGEGAPPPAALEELKALDGNVARSVTNVQNQLGAALEDNWGLETLVRVGETWLPRMVDTSNASSPGHHGKARKSSIVQPPGADVPLLKLFEFLTASLCLYVIDEEPGQQPNKRDWNVYTTSKRGKAPGWWTIAAGVPAAGPLLNPLLQRTMNILLTVLRLNLPSAWKSVQLGVVMLWNAAVQSASVERYQVEAGVCTMLLSLINGQIWPPTLRDMAAGHLHSLLETHTNMLHLGWEYEQHLVQQAAAAAEGGARGSMGGASQRGSMAGARYGSQGGASNAPLAASPTPPSPTGGSSPSSKRRSKEPKVDLAAILGPEYRTKYATKPPGCATLQPAAPPPKAPSTPDELALAAAGQHPGYVPFMRALVGLITTRQPLLEMRGALGIARACCAAPQGGPEGLLLGEAKATAAAVGALEALVGMLRLAAAKYLLVERREVLPPPPALSPLVDREYHVYERDVNTPEGLLELLWANCCALLNLSVLPSNQPKLAKVGLLTLLSANTSLYEHITTKPQQQPVELRLLDMLAATIQNLASHPSNRTRLYKAELLGATALERALEGMEGPPSPEPLDVASSTLAGGQDAASSRAQTAATATSGRLSPSRVGTAGVGSRSGRSRSRSSSPAAGARRPPALQLPALQASCGSPSPGRGSPLGKAPAATSSSNSPSKAAAGASGSGLRASQEYDVRQQDVAPAEWTPEAIAAVARPKVLLPPITKLGGDVAWEVGGHSVPGVTAGSPRAGQSPKSPHGPIADGSAGVSGVRSASMIQNASAVMSGSGGRLERAGRSLKSRAGTSVWGAPGSPIAPPDSREQFLIWMEATFTEGTPAAPYAGPSRGGAAEEGRRSTPGTAGGHSSGGGPGGGGGGEVPQGGGQVTRTRRRLLWDENGEWVEVEPESSRTLHRLLCRPVSHMWQETPEARARAGNARWAPAVSEYREGSGRCPLTHAAQQLLTTGPPPEAPLLATATQQLATTGRCEVEDVTWERPTTSERQRGSVPMTVLHPRPEYAAAAGSSSSSSDAHAPGSLIWDQQQQQRGTGDRSSVPGKGGAWEQGGGATSSSKAATSPGQTPQVPLKVALSPQRRRTVISFENKTTHDEMAHAKPVLTLFEHVEGARVGEGLFTEYTLPNGKKAFMYYNGGGVMDEAEVAPTPPPPRPTSVPLALQQTMPLGNVLNKIARPPSSSPPFLPPKPVPRLVPLPPCHTLKVVRPDVKEAWAFGQLRDDPLQLVLVAKAITQPHTEVQEEDVFAAAPEEREPWSLPTSIFKGRAKEADARAFYDGGATLDRMFERDWQRATGKDKFTSMLCRENKTNAAGKSDKQAMQEVHDVLQKHYQVFYSTFLYYASGGNDPYHMPLNAFTSFLDDCAIPEPESLSIKRSDCDTIFIVCNFQPDKKSPDVAVNDEHALMRFEFMEAVVRLAIAKYGKGQATDDLATAVEHLFERNLLPRLAPQAQLVANDFRSGRFYNEEVDLLLKKHQNMLRALYSRYRLKPAGGGLRPKVLLLDGWLALMSDARLVDSQFPLSDAVLCFLWARMYVIDEIKDYSRYTSLTFVDFLEALGRVADAKSLPTASDLDAAGYPNVLGWALDKERLEGSVSGAAAPSASQQQQQQGAAATARSEAGALMSISGAPGASSAGDGGGGSCGGGAAEGGSGGGGGAEEVVEGSSGGMTAAAPPPDAAAGGAGMATARRGGGGGVPDIFQPRASARFGAPKPRPLYAKLDMLLDLIMRRLYWDPAQPESVFSIEGLVKMVKKIDKDLGP